MNPQILCDAAFALRGSGGARMVPAPIVKIWLQELVGERIPTPAGIALPAGDAGSNLAHAAWDGLREPLRLKAFGPGLTKREPGAVASGLQGEEVTQALHRMGRTLSVSGRLRHGYLIEEQQPEGVEVSVTAVRRSDGAVGLKINDLLLPCPISSTDAEAAAGELPETVNRAAFADLLLAVGGMQGSSVVEDLGDLLLAFECNPVVVTATGVCAVDTQLILAPR